MANGPTEGEGQSTTLWQMPCSLCTMGGPGPRCKALLTICTCFARAPLDVINYEIENSIQFILEFASFFLYSSLSVFRFSLVVLHAVWNMCNWKINSYCLIYDSPHCKLFILSTRTRRARQELGRVTGYLGCGLDWAGLGICWLC